MGNAYLYALASMFFWSLYPLMTAFGLLDMHPALFVLIVQLAAGVGSILCVLPLIRSPHEIYHALKAQLPNMRTPHWLGLITVGLCSSLFNLCVVFGMVMLSPAGVSIIIGVAPLMTMVLSSFLIRKDWSMLRPIHFVLGVTAMIGAIMVVVASDQVSLNDEPWNGQPHPESGVYTVLGGLIAWVGAIMLALSNSIRAQVSNIVKQLIPSSQAKYDITLVGTFIGEAVCRMFSILPALLIWVVFGFPFQAGIQGTLSGLLTGLIIFNMASCLYSVALLKAVSPSVSLVSFVGPVLGVIWLAIFGMSDITFLHILGMTLIVGSNVMLFKINTKDGKANKADDVSN